jgi:hypothetical protein
MNSSNDVAAVIAMLDVEPMGDRQLTVKIGGCGNGYPAPRYEKLWRPGEPEKNYARAGLGCK